MSPSPFLLSIHSFGGTSKLDHREQGRTRSNRADKIVVDRKHVFLDLNENQRERDRTTLRELFANGALRRRLPLSRQSPPDFRSSLLINRGKSLKQ
jgi:hypothetical protein